MQSSGEILFSGWADPMLEHSEAATKIFVTDYDGTLTRDDFFQLVMDELLPPGTPNHWQQYLDNQLSHFEVLERIFAAIRTDEATMLKTARRCGLDTDLKPSVQRLREEGWEVIVASAGCRWYIERMLAEADVRLTVHANPGEFSAATGLTMLRPVESPFYSPETGIDKGAIVRWYVDRGCTVAFAGDGRADFPAAAQLPIHRRFARATLASMLDRAGQQYQPFDTWSAVADQLLAEDS